MVISCLIGLSTNCEIYFSVSPLAFLVGLFSLFMENLLTLSKRSYGDVGRNRETQANIFWVVRISLLEKHYRVSLAITLAGASFFSFA